MNLYHQFRENPCLETYNALPLTDREKSNYIYSLSLYMSPLKTDEALQLFVIKNIQGFFFSDYIYHNAMTNEIKDLAHARFNNRYS